MLRPDGDRFVVDEVGADGREHLGPQPGGTRPHRAAAVSVGEQPPVLGVAHQVVGQGTARAEDVEQAAAQPHVAVELVDEVVGVVGGFEQQGQAAQRGVGVGRRGQCREQPVVAREAGQRRCSGSGRAGRLGEADPREPVPSGSPSQAPTSEPVR